jgi:preprotein translocase subunit SecA
LIFFLVNGIQKLFGNKADKDVKGLEPFVGKINSEFIKLENLSHDELRSKTITFKNKVNDYLSDIDQQIADLKSEIKKSSAHEIDRREDAYDKIDILEKERDEN